MKEKLSHISILFYGLMVSVSLSKLAYGMDPVLPLDNENLYCPGYANCTSAECQFNRIVPTSESKAFNQSYIPAVICDTLEVDFKYPNWKNDSFVGNVSWTCYRYYDTVKHHLAIAVITINKPSDVETSNIACETNIGNCTLLNDTSSGLQYVAGMPDMCFPGTTFLPSHTDVLTCEGYSNCTDANCDFNRTFIKTIPTRDIYPDSETIISCNTLDVHVKYPTLNDTAFTGKENFSCYAYSNGNGTSFLVAEMAFTKPSDMKTSGFTCKFGDKSDCILQNETSNQLVYYAGVPSNCTPWVPPLPETSTTVPSTTVPSTDATTAENTTTPQSNNITAPSVSTAGSVTTEAPSGTTMGVETTTKGQGVETTTKGQASSLESASFMIMVAALGFFLSFQNLQM